MKLTMTLERDGQKIEKIEIVVNLERMEELDMAVSMGLENMKSQIRKMDSER